VPGKTPANLSSRGGVILMARDYTYATKYQLCPHCDRDSGCKIFDDGKVWCLRISTQLDVAPGYRLIGWLGNGMGASVIPDDGEEDWQQKQERIEYENRRRQWERQKSQGLNQLLSIEERNSQYRKIAKRLDLSRQHRQQLRDRGLTESEIDFAFERGWLRTWQSGEPTIGANPLLAGINPLTLKLTGVDGFSIAACDPNGAISGHQIAPDNRTKLGKYIWLSSKSYNGNGPQLTNQELPLFVWRHPQALQTEDIYLIEGALKSLLVAFFLWRQGNRNIVVIGTAAAARYGKKTLREYLLGLKANRIVLLPDAGAVANPHINKANQQTLDWLQKWGYHTQVADWRQFHDKSQPDFDELLATDRDCEIKFISGSEYLTQTGDRQLDIFAGFTRWLENLFKRYKPKKGFGRQSPSRSIEPASIIRYKPGKLPKYSDYCDRHPPRIVYKKGERLLLWKEAILAGWQHILDTSAPGLGKSYSAGILNPKEFEVEQLWYFTELTRNVTTKTVKQGYTYLEPRHDGLVNATDPLGNSYLRRPKEKEKPDTRGNCHLSNLFIELYKKNIPSLEETDNPICNNCHLRGACRNSVGGGFGYRFSRYQTLQSSKILAHLDSAPSDGYNWGRTGLIFDEVTRIVKPVKTIEVSLADLNSTIVELTEKAPEIGRRLIPLWKTLRNCIEGKQRLPRYGWKDSQVRQLCWDAFVFTGQSCPLTCLLSDKEAKQTESLSCAISCSLFDSPLSAIEEIVEALSQDLSFLGEPEDRLVLSDVEKEWKRLAFWANQHMRRESYQKKAELARAVPLNWFISFLEVLHGLVAGSLSLNYGKLSIAIHNPRHGNIAKASKWNIYLDSTINCKYLALWLGRVFKL
jgi:hypothetical protein